jgi:predicted patatin/cPLA2 family phospholipase
MSEPRCEVSSGRLRIAVSLQGGGSHGAFTWGVLDRLLPELWHALNLGRTMLAALLP